MIDAQTGELKEIGTGSYNVTKWVVPTRMTSYNFFSGTSFSV